MSKDIRSYFAASPVNKNVSKITNKNKKSTKKIIISDSESEDETPKPKKESKTKSSPGNQGNKAKGETKSQYFKNLKPINPLDVFSSAPVTQTGIPVKNNKEVSKPKKNIKSILQEDDDFEEVLLQLNDDNMKILVNEKPTSSRNEDSNSPRKSNSSMKIDKLNLDSSKTGNCVSNKPVNHKTSPKKNRVETEQKPIANECLVMSESSDSENERNSKGISKNKISPVKSPVKRIVNGKSQSYKSECMDLSESDSEEEFTTKKKIVAPKRKNDSSEKATSSTKKQKVNNETDLNKSRDDVKRKRIGDIVSDKYTSPKKSMKDQSSVSSIKKPINNIKEIPKAPLSSLWVDKYKPTNVKQVIGQQGDNSNVKKLINWLKNWKKNHNGKTKLSRPSPWAKNDDGAYFKAALLSGPPGIGKTTTAHLVCKELSFDVVEFNASDTRSKKLLQQEVSELLSSTSLAPYFTGGSDHEVSKNHVLVMDEVDGMAGNEDRGGVQELIQLIKTSRVPVICMCNDRNHPKMRSLVNYCFDLRFNRPRVEQIKGAMMSICYKEGLKINPDQLNEIIRSTNQDIRLILNHLSVLAAQKNSTLPNSEKFIKLGPWDVLRKVFSEEELNKMSFYEKSDLFFHDYSIAPLFVYENFLSVVPHAKLNKIEKMKVFAKAAESISTGDIVEKTIRTSNAWSLLPVEAVFASVVPGETLKGHMGGQINFPSWLGKNSSKNKMDRLLQELLVHTRLKASGSKDAINLDYSCHLRNLIIRPLVESGSEGVPSALQALHSYDMLKEDLENLYELCKWPHTKDPMDKVESKVKAAFTRAYNKSSGLSPYAITAPIKKGRGTASSLDADSDALYPENDNAAVSDEDQEDDSIEVDAMVVAKKKSNKKAEPSTSKQRGSGKRGRGSKK